MLKLLLLFIIVCNATKYVSVFESYGNYCGYKTGDANFKKNPIDEIDKICMYHDFCVSKNGIKYLECHINFAKDVEKIKLENSYIKKVKQTIKRVEECYEEKIAKPIVGLFGILMLLNPITAPLTVFSTAYSLSENEKCVSDIQFILGSLYGKFI